MQAFWDFGILPVKLKFKNKLSFHHLKFFEPCMFNTHDLVLQDAYSQIHPAAWAVAMAPLKGKVIKFEFLIFLKFIHFTWLLLHVLSHRDSSRRHFYHLVLENAFRPRWDSKWEHHNSYCRVLKLLFSVNWSCLFLYRVYYNYCLPLKFYFKMYLP